MLACPSSMATKIIGFHINTTCIVYTSVNLGRFILCNLQFSMPYLFTLCTVTIEFTLLSHCCNNLLIYS